ncbi:m7GpppN-mRNA hydrolase-like [Pholidichthys leucotaenia]
MIMDEVMAKKIASKSRHLAGADAFPGENWTKHKQQKSQGLPNQYELNQKSNSKGNGKRSQDSPYVKNGASNQQIKTILKEDKRLQPRKLQDSFDKDVASFGSCGHLTNENRDCEQFLSSKAFLNFKFDRDAIMKCFDC